MHIYHLDSRSVHCHPSIQIVSTKCKVDRTFVQVQNRCHHFSVNCPPVIKVQSAPAKFCSIFLRQDEVIHLAAASFSDSCPSYFPNVPDLSHQALFSNDCHWLEDTQKRRLYQRPKSLKRSLCERKSQRVSIFCFYFCSLKVLSNFSHRFIFR